MYFEAPGALVFSMRRDRTPPGTGRIQMSNTETFDLDKLIEIIERPADERCMVPPSPGLNTKMKNESERLNNLKRVRDVGGGAILERPTHPGFNDGLIVPGSHFPLGTSIDKVRSAAADRTPLHGVVRVAVVLVDFDDEPMTETQQHFEDLFFSEGVVGTGSVREYFTEVTNGLVEIEGTVVGPYRMPRDMSDYANGESGTGSATPNARTMANDAAVASNPDIDFGPFDNDANGFVDAFVVVHAGAGAEVSGSVNEIWSHKWVLPSTFNADGTSIYAYLTVPEDAKIGVCAHELGHLLFGFPDLYDTDGTSEGVGDWCLMAGGSWGGGGDTPAHPSAWCKSQQSWVTVQNVSTNGTLSIADVKDAQTVYRLWKDGTGGQEYFLVENRQQDRFDASLPAGGLLIWHIDDAISNNTNEAHYRVALEQADGNDDLENNTNRGDGGDCFPGTAGNRTFNNTSTPNSKSYGGLNTCVSVTAISDPGAVMTAQVQVQCGKNNLKDFKDQKDGSKETRKEIIKEKEWKELRKENAKENIKEKEWKELRKENVKEDVKEDIKEKEWKEGKEYGFDKRPEKPETDKSSAYDKPPYSENKVVDDKFTDGKFTDGKFTEVFDDRFGRKNPAPQPAAAQGGGLEHRLAALEAAIASLLQRTAMSDQAQPFIGRQLRPDLRSSALLGESDGGQPSGPIDKRSYDCLPPQG